MPQCMRRLPQVDWYMTIIMINKISVYTHSSSTGSANHGIADIQYIQNLSKGEMTLQVCWRPQHVKTFSRRYGISSIVNTTLGKVNFMIADMASGQSWIIRLEKLIRWYCSKVIWGYKPFVNVISINIEPRPSPSIIYYDLGKALENHHKQTKTRGRI